MFDDAALGKAAVVSSVYAALALSTAALATGVGPVSAPQPNTLRWTECTNVADLDKLPDADQRRFRCGTLLVPLDRNAKDQRRLELSVVVIAPAAGLSKAVPLLMLHGASTGFVRRSAQPTVLALARERTVVRFDLRGIDTSGIDPCRATASERAMVLGQGLTGTALKHAWYAPYRPCFAAMRAAGFDASQFGTHNHTQDAELLRKALGFERWHVYGSSYGTTVAMHYAAAEPERVASLVLDGPYPADPTPVTLTQSLTQALDGATVHCRATKRCGASSANFRSRYEAAVELLAARPLAVPLEGRSPATPFILNGESFGFLSRAMLYGPLADGPSARFLDAALARDTTLLAPMVADAIRRLGAGNDGVFAMNECRDRPRYRTPAPPFAFAELLDMREVCPWWTTEVAPPLTPRKGTVPALVLSSTSDPGTPVAFGDEAARRLGAIGRVILPGAVHGASPGQPCGMQAITEFLRAPSEWRSAEACGAFPSATGNSAN